MSENVRHASFEEMMCTLERVISDGGSMAFMPAGRSMLPTIRDRKDVVTIAPAENIKKYDIVLYRRKSGKVVLHRVVRILGDGVYMMCGDSQFMLEYPIEKEYVIGKVSHILRGERTIDCTDLSFLSKVYVRVWDMRLILKKTVYTLKQIVKKYYRKMKKNL